MEDTIQASSVPLTSREVKKERFFEFYVEVEKTP